MTVLRFWESSWLQGCYGFYPCQRLLWSAWRSRKCRSILDLPLASIWCAMLWCKMIWLMPIVFFVPESTKLPKLSPNKAPMLTNAANQKIRLCSTLLPRLLLRPSLLSRPISPPWCVLKLLRLRMLLPYDEGFQRNADATWSCWEQASWAFMVTPVAFGCRWWTFCRRSRTARRPDCALFGGDLYNGLWGVRRRHWPSQYCL